MLRRRDENVSVHVTTIAASDLLPVQHSTRLPSLVDHVISTRDRGGGGGGGAAAAIPFRFRMKSARGARKGTTTTSSSSSSSTSYSSGNTEELSQLRSGKHPIVKRRLSTLILPPIAGDRRPSPLAIRSERSVVKRPQLRPPLRPLLNDLSLVQRPPLPLAPPPPQPPPDMPTKMAADASRHQDTLYASYAKAVGLNLEDLGGRCCSLIEEDAYDRFARRKPFKRS